MLRGDNEPQGHLLLTLHHHDRLHHRFGLESGQEALEPPSESQDWMEDQRVRGAGKSHSELQSTPCLWCVRVAVCTQISTYRSLNKTQKSVLVVSRGPGTLEPKAMVIWHMWAQLRGPALRLYWMRSARSQ